MLDSQSVQIAVEGDLDDAVLKRIVSEVDVKVQRVHGRKGKDWLKKNIKRFNMAARLSKWIVLVDLNHEENCPPPLVTNWLSPQSRNPNLQFRVAVRAVEAWLLADRDEIAHYLSVAKKRINQTPEDLDNPKEALINIARHSKSKTIRNDIVPPEGSTAKQGPGYTSCLIQFALKQWNPEQAALRAPSLKRSIDSLAQWVSA